MNLAVIVLKFRGERVVFVLVDGHKMAACGGDMVMPRPQGRTGFDRFLAQWAVEGIAPFRDVIKKNRDVFPEIVAEERNTLCTVIPVKMGAFDPRPRIL